MKMSIFELLSIGQTVNLDLKDMSLKCRLSYELH